MLRLARTALKALAALIFTAVLLELGTCAAVRSGLLVSPAPSYGHTGVWWGDQPQLGVWHRPYARGRMGGACYSTIYRINSVGARDVERVRHTKRPRVVVLGDSFLEGWGLPEQARLSNLLQRETGIPHLNFAMAHFSPYQMLLAYRLLASSYDHDAVLVSVLPTNDIADSDLDLGRRIRGYEYRYRPYLIKGPDGWKRFDYREPRLRRWLRMNTYTFGAFRRAFYALTPDEGLGLAPPPGNKPFSFFYEFKESEVVQIEEVLRRLANAARPRPLAVLLIPTLPDLQRYAIDGDPPFTAHLRAAAQRDGWHLVDLMPAMAGYTRRWANYFLPCDYHWSRFGNRVAADLVRRDLDGLVYGPGSVTARAAKGDGSSP